MPGNIMQSPIDVSIVCVSMRSSMFNNILENLSRQRYPSIELILIRHNIDELNLQQKEILKHFKVRVYEKGAESTLGSLLNLGFALAEGNILIKWDDDDFYGSFFVSEAVYFTRLKNTIVGKGSWLSWMDKLARMYVRFPGASFRYVSTLAGGTIAIPRLIQRQVMFPDLNLGEDQAFIKNALALGYPAYATSPYNYVQIRRSDPNTHAWPVSDAYYLEKAVCLGEIGDYSVCEREIVAELSAECYRDLFLTHRRPYGRVSSK